MTRQRYKRCDNDTTTNLVPTWRPHWWHGIRSCKLKQNDWGGRDKRKNRRRDEKTGLAGVFAKGRIENNEVLVTVPSDRILKLDDPEEEGPMCCGTVAAIAREMRLGNESKLAPFANYFWTWKPNLMKNGGREESISTKGGLQLYWTKGIGCGSWYLGSKLGKYAKHVWSGGKRYSIGFSKS